MKSLLTLSLLAIALVFFTDCNNHKKSEYSSQKEIKEPVATTTQDHPGKKLMENKCYVCHNPTTGHEGRIAPPMVAVKSHYITDEITKQEFEDAIWNFVEKPTEQKSKMRGAVKRFNLMPYQPFNEDEIRQIADYMYRYQIDEPEWFKKHLEEEGKGKMKYRNDGEKMDATNSKETKRPAERGLEYALDTKKELGKNLMGTIQDKGIKEAVTFCNVKAYPLTDSMATAQNATIKRVSDKPRNPQNRANTKELKIIEKFKKAVANGEDYQPVTEVENGRNSFYYPIATNSMCLQCHGIPNKTIQPEVLSTIKDLYPNDEATGYDINEVRGMWAIEFDSTG